MPRMTQEQLNQQLFRAVREAIYNNNLEAVKKAIDDGAEVNATDAYGKTPLEIAELYKSTEIIELLKQRCSMTQDQLNEQLFKAVKANDIEAVKKAIKDGAEVNAKNENGCTPLHCAAGKGHTDIAELLIEARAPVNAIDKYGCTPLHWAAWDGYTEIAKILIEKGAPVNATDEDGETPLHLAACNGHTEAAKILIENGAFINAKNKDGDTSLHIATKWRNTETAALLKQHGGLE